MVGAAGMAVGGMQRIRILRFLVRHEEPEKIF